MSKFLPIFYTRSPSTNLCQVLFLLAGLTLVERLYDRSGALRADIHGCYFGSRNRMAVTGCPLMAGVTMPRTFNTTRKIDYMYEVYGNQCSSDAEQS